MTDEVKQAIEIILNANDYNSVERLKSLVLPYGAPSNHSCFCKDNNKIDYLNRVKEWFNSLT